METTSTSVDKIKKSNMVELTGKFMVVSIIVIFLVLFFVFFIHLYSKWFWNRQQQQSTTSTRRRRRFDFSPGHQEVCVLNGGLDPTLLKTIPVVVFSLKEFKDGLECAVCLCDLSEGEKARLLPKCNHGFHVECIDMWFQSHSTCPLCRNPVCNDHKEEEEDDLATVEVANFPTNVLFWGNESQVSTLGPCLEESTSSSNSSCPPSSSSLVIDIPRQTNEEEEEEKSPVPTRLRSLKRLLSRDRRGNPSSPRIVDVEQGARD